MTGSASGSTTLDEITIEELQRRYASGELTCVDVVAHHLHRMDRAGVGRPGNAIVSVNPRALESAERLDDAFRLDGRLTGALHGVPIVVKDQFETVDMPTSFGSRAVTPRLADADATVVQRLRAAGAIIMAKTAMSDFGLSLLSRSSRSGHTANAHDRRRDAGGSSGGSAAAVAGGLSVAGLGLDSSGSVRLPASFNGLVGMRATPGLLPTTGASPILTGQDVPGPLTRTVRDAALMFQAMTGPTRSVCIAGLDPGRGLHGVRIGILRLPPRADLDSQSEQVASIVARAAIDLGRLGATLSPVTPARVRAGRALSVTPLIRRDLGAYLSARPQFGIRDVADLGDPSGADLLTTLVGPAADAGCVAAVLDDRVRRRIELVRTLRRHEVDILCYPTAMLPAPWTSDVVSGRWTTRTFPSLTWLAAQAGVPAITVPGGFSAEGLPVGIEFLAMPYAESLLFEVAGQYERATWHRRAPGYGPVTAGR